MAEAGKRVGLVENTQPGNATWCARTESAGTIVLSPRYNTELALRAKEGKLWAGYKAGTNTAAGDGPNSDAFNLDSTWKLEAPWSINVGGSNKTQADWAMDQRARIFGLIGKPTNLASCGLKDNGCWREYTNAPTIYWSPKVGAWYSTGAIREVFSKDRRENGVLGYPTSQEFCGLKDNGCYQNYEGGAIYWNPKTGGSRITSKEILAKYRDFGAQASFIGYPTQHTVCGAKNNGCYESFQYGAFYWSPGTGAHLTGGSVRAEWAKTGYENGRLGYPTSEEIPDGAPGKVYQTYEGGTIFWDPKVGARIVYK